MFRSEYAVISPVPSWNARKDLQLSDRIRIERIPEAERPKFEAWNEFLSLSQIRDLSRKSFWFRYDFQAEPLKGTESKFAATELLRNVLIAYQVARPVGTGETATLVIPCEKTKNGLVIDTIHNYRRLETTLWGRMIASEPVDFGAISAVSTGVQEAVARRVVRLQNPLYLLEMGQQADNPHIRVLLWVAGLDALLMARNAKVFERRLFNFLGRQTFVFPAVADLAQPQYTLGDVVLDLYELRNTIAHGGTIHKRFRDELGFKDVGGNLIDGYNHTYQRRQILEEAALFLLCSALRRVFVNNLTGIVADTKGWRDHLEKQVASR
jgi:hypothetical protein